MANTLVLFEDENLKLKVTVSPEQDTVWLTANRMAELYGRDEKTIRKHINKIFADGELDKENNTQKMRVVGVKQPVAYYDLDVILSVGYRVNSRRGIAFRRWANGVLRDYIVRGYAVNHTRITQLGEVIRIMKRTENRLDAKQVLSVIEKYSMALDLLDDYDHQSMRRPRGSGAVCVLTYEECRKVIDSMKFSADSALFGNKAEARLTRRDLPYTPGMIAPDIAALLIMPPGTGLVILDTLVRRRHTQAELREAPAYTED